MSDPETSDALSELAALTAPGPRPIITLVHDCPCVHCGYNLRGLKFDGQCPECGNSIEASCRGRWLCYADPRWVRRLAWGARLTAAAPLLAFCAVFFVGRSFPGRLVSTPAVDFAADATFVILCAAAAIGAWLLTTPAPACETLESLVSVRRLTRCITPLCAALVLGCLFLLADRLTTGPTPLRFAPLIAIGAGIAASCVWLLYLATLSARLIDAPLLSPCRPVALATFCTPIAGCLLTLVAGDRFDGRELATIFGLAGILLLGWGEFLLIYAAFALGRAAELARVAALYPRADFSR